VKISGRLAGENDLWSGDDGASDAGELLLAAGKLRRRLVSLELEDPPSRSVESRPAVNPE
jgi:hypothetical protein